jgi:hypothetical protein
MAANIIATVNQKRAQMRTRAGKSGAHLRQYAEATLGGGSLRKVVKLPEGEDENEWLAVNSGCSVCRPIVRARSDERLQWSTFTTKSTFSTAPLPSFAPHSRAPR